VHFVAKQPSARFPIGILPPYGHTLPCPPASSPSASTPPISSSALSLASGGAPSSGRLGTRQPAPTTSPVRQTGEPPRGGRAPVPSTRPLPTPPPFARPSPTTGRRAAVDGELVVSLVVHMRGDHMGDAMAELSAGYHVWKDAEPALSVRNLVARSLLQKPAVSGRLIRLWCLFTDDLRAGRLRDTFARTRLPPEDDRRPAQAKADRGTFEAIVNLANYCTEFSLDTPCKQTVVTQALHVAERGNHHLVTSTWTSIKNDRQKHAVSATRVGEKTTITSYAACIRRFCAWAAEKVTSAVGVIPLSQHVVVSWLNVEATRRLVRKPSQRRGRGRGAAGSRGTAAAAAYEIASDSSAGYSVG